MMPTKVTFKVSGVAELERASEAATPGRHYAVGDASGGADIGFEGSPRQFRALAVTCGACPSPRQPPPTLPARTKRVAELEAQLDAATKLSEIKAIAGELQRTRSTLQEAKVKRDSASQRPKRGTSRRSVRRSTRNASEPASASK
jgi:hypothetical protein